MKRKIFAVCVVCALLSIAVVGTLAYFTDKSEATVNTFTFGDVDIDFSEEDWEQPDAVEPGMTYKKNPCVTNVGTNDAWVRFDVTLSDWTAFKAAAVAHAPEMDDLSKMFNGFDDNFVRASITENATDDSVTYTYYYKNALASGESATLFESVTVPGCLTNSDIEAIGDDFTITVTGYAVQADGFDTAEEAFSTVTEFEEYEG